MTSSWLGATELTGRVTIVTLAKNFGNFAFIKLDALHTAPIACAINGSWSYTLPLATEFDKKMYSTILTAAALGRPVRLMGSGTCSDFSAIESAGGVEFAP